MTTNVVASPVGFYDSVIPNDLIKLILKEIKNIKSDEFNAATVGDSRKLTVETKIRNSKISWWYESHWVSSIFSHYFNKANRDIWEYDLTHLAGVQVTKYEPGDYYNWHCDYGYTEDANHTRKLSASLLISDESDYEGGDLQIIDYSGNTISVPKSKGTMIIFDSRVPHRVTPVTKGKRISLVAWMLGPKLK